jgi:AraC-like DNA-binding protein
MACMFALILGLIVSVTQIVYYRFKQEALFWLALANLASIFGFAELFLFKSGLILHAPHLFRLSFVFSLIYMPLSYIYVRTAVLGITPSRRDVFHILPTAIFLLDHLPFYTSSASQKLLMLAGHEPFYAITHFSQGAFLTHEFYIFLIAFTYCIYGAAELIVLLKYGKEKRDFFAAYNSPWIKWFFFYLLMQFLVMIPALIIFLSGDAAYLVDVSGVFAIINAIFISCSLFLHPDTSPGTGIEAFAFPKQILDPTYFESPRLETENVSSRESYDVKQLRPTKSLTIEQMFSIRDEIDMLLGEQEPFLKHGYSLQELSNSLSRPLYQVSAIINQVYDSNFNELINKHRINYAVKMIREKKSQHLNIYGLADRCGFNNRNSFTAAFKKVTGSTPSDYFKDH